jgi:hypothetical protein
MLARQLGGCTHGHYVSERMNQNGGRLGNVLKHIRDSVPRAKKPLLIVIISELTRVVMKPLFVPYSVIMSHTMSYAFTESIINVEFVLISRARTFRSCIIPGLLSRPRRSPATKLS